MGASLLLPRLRHDQWRIVEHPAKVKVICMGRRWGKTVLSGAVGLSASSQGAKVLWMVPTYKNARPIWRWAEMATAPLVKRGLVRTNKTERTLDFPTSGGFLGIYSSDNDTAVRGDWFNLAILDEAAKIPRTTWTDVVQPALADANGDAILPSTPAGKNWFWEEWQRGYRQMDGEIAAFRAPSSDNPMPTIRRAAQLAGDGRIPESTYRQEWLAEFVEAATQSFLREWFDATEDHPARRYDATDQRHHNACIARWISWDTALSDSDDAAYSACVVGDLTPDYRLLVREVWRDRLTFPNLVAQIERLAAKWGVDVYRGERKLRGVVIESKVSGISAYQTLTETTDAWLRPLIVPFAPQGSKEARAELAAVWVKNGCVWLPDPSPEVPWLQAFEGELFAFPQGQWKDQVDAFSQLVLYTSKWLQAGHEARQRAAARLAAQEETPQ